MSVRTVVTRGYGNGGSIPFVVTRGYGNYGGGQPPSTGTPERWFTATPRGTTFSTDARGRTFAALPRGQTFGDTQR